MLAKSNDTHWLTTHDAVTNFKVKETACPCCGLNLMQQRQIDTMQGLRDAVSIALKVTSGYRCPKHNAAVGGAPKSQHLDGIAADLMVVSTNYNLEKFYKLAVQSGFDGIGLDPYRNFLHCDTRGSTARWKYDSTGKTVKWDGKV